MSSWLVGFALDILPEIVGVFVGVWLALITERRREARVEAQLEQERARQFTRARHTILGSVVKNTGEAKGDPVIVFAAEIE